MKKTKSLTIEHLPIADLKAHPRNYRIHTDEQLLHIIKSLEENGFYRNIIIAKDNTILAGHGVIEAAKKMGKKTAPCFRVPFGSDSPEAMKVLIGDNEMGHLAEINDRFLTDMLKELKISDMLLGTGYDDMMLAGRLFTTRTEKEIADFNAAKEWAGMPDYEEESEEIKLIVNFRTDAARTKFIEKTGIEVSKITRMTKIAWYPAKERNDISSVKFE